jgi:diazepam-binding inhibitor (GABA receptor modulating acyl-CoA-binding protein)
MENEGAAIRAGRGRTWRLAMAGKAKSLESRFAEAKSRVEGLKSRPSNDELLQLYGLYKQATEGDVSGSRPGLLDVKGRAKHDAWARRKGSSRDEAMKAYVALVDGLAKKHG